MRDDQRIDATITDLALCIADGSKSFCFPGPAQIPPEFRNCCGALVQRCNEKRRERPEQDDFAVSHQDIVWRAHFDEQSIDGEWYRLRRMPRHAPYLGDGGLPSRLLPALGALLRIALYQRLLGDILQAQILVSPSPNSRVATAIAGGQLLWLFDEVQMQANLVRAGADLWKTTGATA